MRAENVNRGEKKLKRTAGRAVADAWRSISQSRCYQIWNEREITVLFGSILQTKYSAAHLPSLHQWATETRTSSISPTKSTQANLGLTHLQWDTSCTLSSLLRANIMIHPLIGNRKALLQAQAHHSIAARFLSNPSHIQSVHVTRMARERCSTWST